MEFDDILESIINPGPEGPDPTAFDQLREAHHGALEAARADYDTVSGERDSAVGERDAALASVVEVKAMNFDKLMAAGTPANGDPDLKTTTIDEDVSKGEMSTSDFFEKESN